MSLKLGGLHEKHAVATWNLGTICLKTEENQENLCRDDRSQDLNQLIFVMVKCCVLFEVRPGFLNNI
jgi:hypothetical protein